MFSTNATEGNRQAIGGAVINKGAQMVIEMMAIKLERMGYCPKKIDRKECTDAPCRYCIQNTFERYVRKHMGKEPVTTPAQHLNSAQYGG